MSQHHKGKYNLEYTYSSRSYTHIPFPAFFQSPPNSETLTASFFLSPDKIWKNFETHLSFNWFPVFDSFLRSLIWICGYRDSDQNLWGRRRRELRLRRCGAITATESLRTRRFWCSIKKPSTSNVMSATRSYPPPAACKFTSFRFTRRPSRSLYLYHFHVSNSIFLRANFVCFVRDFSFFFWFVLNFLILVSSVLLWWLSEWRVFCITCVVSRSRTWSLGLICENCLIVMSGGGSLAEGENFHEFTCGFGF